MVRDLFHKTNVSVIDGDNRLNCCNPMMRPRLSALLNSGIDLYGIQIFHYASVHYETRHKKWSMRFLNAIMNGASIIRNVNGHLALSNHERHELQVDSSEVLGVGLSNILMCKWFDINLNNLECIDATGKRCDYRFRYNGNVIVYESRGRADKNQISAALRDGMQKKVHHVANEKYTVICYLPRNGSFVQIRLYDPPSREGKVIDDVDYILAKHYRTVTSLAGLSILSNSINDRIISYERTGRWNREQLDLKGNIEKMGWDFNVNNQRFWTRLYPNVIIGEEKHYYVHMALHDDVKRMLVDWKLDELKEFHLEEKVYENERISVLQDGSLLYFSDRRIG